MCIVNRNEEIWIQNNGKYAVFYEGLGVIIWKINIGTNTSIENQAGKQNIESF